MREMSLSFVTVAAQGFYRSGVRNCYPLPDEKTSELQWFRGFLCSLSVFAEF